MIMSMFNPLCGTVQTVGVRNLRTKAQTMQVILGFGCYLLASLAGFCVPGVILTEICTPETFRTDPLL